jgi:ferredoxin
MAKAKINKDACIGCGLCAGMHADVFAIDDDGKAKLIGEDEAAIEDAVANCPVGAIEIEK